MVPRYAGVQAVQLRQCATSRLFPLFGLGNPLRFKWVSMRVSRHEVTGHIKHDIGSTMCYRAAATAQATIRRLERDPSKPFWREALADLLHGDLLGNLEAIISRDSLLELREHLLQYLVWCYGQSSKPPFLQARLDALVRKADKDAIDSRSRSWNGWIDRSLQRGASAAHRFCNQPNKPEVVPCELPAKPADDVVKATSEWCTKWKADSPSHVLDYSRVVQEAIRMAQARNRSLDEYLQLFTPDLIRRTCSAINKSTAIGCDGVSFQDVASLPDEALLGLCRFFASLMVSFDIPNQCTEQWMSLFQEAWGMADHCDYAELGKTTP